MFDIDLIMENVSKSILEDIGSPGVSAAKKVSKAISNIVYAIKSYDRDYKTMPTSQRKPAYLKACGELKTAMKEAEADKDFKYDKTRWNVLKNTMAKAEENFPEEVDSEGEKLYSKFLMDTLKSIKKSNNVKETFDPAKDLSNSQDQYNYLQKLYASKSPRAHEAEKTFNKELESRAEYSEKQRQEILTNKDTEKFRVYQNLSKEERRKKYNSGISDVAKEKISNANIPALKSAPVEGCDSVKKLVKLWAENKVPQQGQIEVVSKRGNGLGVPIVCIKGKYYQVPNNQLYTNDKGGIATAASEYRGYTRDATKDPAHDEIRKKLASVYTEEHYFEY